MLRIQYAAEVVEARRLESLAAAERLAGQHIWRDDVIAERFDWGRDQGIYAMAVRVRQLAAPMDLPMLEEYGGCKSWIELEPEMDFTCTNPVLEDAIFEQKLAGISGGLGVRRIILASGSPRRRELLEQMGVKFRVLTAEVEEEHGQGRAARAICRRNALAKAFAVAMAHPKETVLGADTLVHLGDDLLGKPASMSEARRMLGRLSGQTHQVTTACALVQGERRRVFSVTTRVRFRELSARQINAYLKAVPCSTRPAPMPCRRRANGSWKRCTVH